MSITRKLITLNLIAVAAVLGFTLITIGAVRELRSESTKLRDVLVQKEDALRDTIRACGFDGAIHHAKNYILRRDAVYIERFQHARAQAQSAIERYESIAPLTELERSALADVRHMLERYRWVVETASLNPGTPEEIDRLVRTDDSKFSRAVDTLNAHIASVSSASADARVSAAKMAERLVIGLGVVVPLIIGGIGCVSCIVVSRSHKRNAERLSEQMELRELACKAQEQFVANMSHEIRTPLTSIIGFADLLTSPDTSRETFELKADASGAIQRNAHHLLSIVNDILDLAKLNAGKIRLQPTRVDPRSIVEEVVSMFRVRAHAKGISTSLMVHDDVPDWIEIDPLRLRQVLLNIVDNAVKFTDHGSVTVSVRAHGERIRIEVADTGIGMSTDELASIFQPFTQADSGASRRFGGTGLGLNISAKIMKLMNGSIEVTSTQGEGATFAIMFKPVSSGLNDGTSALRLSDADADPVATALEGVRVILAEDGRDNQDLIALMLKTAGADVTVVNNGVELVHRCSAMAEHDGGPFDLVLTDIQMPLMDGYAAVRALRSAGVDIPIVALTAHAMAGDNDRCLEAGCDDYLSKPINRAKLITTCAKLIAERAPSSVAA